MSTLSTGEPGITGGMLYVIFSYGETLTEFIVPGTANRLSPGARG
jgi:hypothetical protein